MPFAEMSHGSAYSIHQIPVNMIKICEKIENKSYAQIIRIQERKSAKNMYKAYKDLALALGGNGNSLEK